MINIFKALIAFPKLASNPAFNEIAGIERFHLHFTVGPCLWIVLKLSDQYGISYINFAHQCTDY